ncbi:hypothetical protein KEJ37_06080 [Candidatus Bathyarchaeota archaeon]|nr:hypothetical protein [Candidatus Bathyarchaeota archaeon]
MKFKLPRNAGLKGNERGVSPAISSVILTGAVVVLVIVAMNFAINLRDSKIAENEFASVRQFMQTAAVQIDDIAWVPWRAQTFRYSRGYGSMSFMPNMLNFTIYFRNSSGEYRLGSYVSGVLAFNMPISRYNLYDSYFELIYPTDNSLADCFIFSGANAPVARVYAIEKLSTGSFVRLVLNPCVRVVEANVSGKRQYKLYLPILYESSSRGNNPTVTFTSRQISSSVKDATKIRVVVTTTPAYGASFFVKSPQGPNTIIDKEIDLGGASTVVFYLSRVEVAVGVNP